MEHHDVVIAGGGYAGIMCAVRLAGRLRRTGTRIALVSPEAAFTERLRLHEEIGTVAWPRSRSLDVASFVGDVGVSFVQGRVASLDAAVRTIQVDADDGSRRTLTYDRLVAAVGSRSDVDRIAGAAQHAYVLDPTGSRGAAALHETLAAHPLARVTVVGAGSTGIELAAELSGRPGRAVTLVTATGFAPFAGPALQWRLRRSLETTGVHIVSGAPVDAIARDRVSTPAGEIAHDICVVCGGFAVPGFLSRAGLEASHDGRVVVDRHLRSRSDPRVYMAGDACLPATPVGAPPRMSAMFALTTGAHVADVIAAEIRDRPLPVFGFWTWGRGIGLGRHAVGFASFPLDRPLHPFITGRLGYHTRAFFIWLLFGLLRLARRWPSVPFWLGRPVRKVSPRVMTTDADVVSEHG